jgi:hypothetical protein
MAKPKRESTVAKPAAPEARRLGRSAATGVYVLAPASKPGLLSMRRARNAVEHVILTKK